MKTLIYCHACRSAAKMKFDFPAYPPAERKRIISIHQALTALMLYYIQVYFK